MKPLVPVVVAAAAMVALAVFVSPVASRAGDDSAVGSSPDATITLSNFQAASVVIGQPNFTSGFPNQAMDTPAADTDAGVWAGSVLGQPGRFTLATTRIAACWALMQFRRQMTLPRISCSARLISVRPFRTTARTSSADLSLQLSSRTCFLSPTSTTAAS